jgi:DNA protecting protein DprA
MFRENSRTGRGTSDECHYVVTGLNPDVAVALLALRAATGSRAAPLWRILASHPQPEALVVELCLTVRARYVRAAKSQLATLPLFDIQMVPVWRLPKRLRLAWPTPPALFVRGDATLLAQPAVAVVGARKAHASAATWAFERGYELGRGSVLVVSGGARGVDTAAHEGALEAGGKTLAYIGVPADEIYPRENRGLFQRMLARGGALATEHPPGIVTYKGEHAMRNRFIAAQAFEVIVVEACATSGALVTADFARRLDVPVRVSPLGIGVAREGIDRLLAAARATVWTQGRL